jgi:phosphoribosylaminoimidazolecarboxamide formyltransferase / IMP cyclohydrolase
MRAKMLPEGLMSAKKLALISVADKRFITNLARDIIRAGYEIVSTGGTYKKLKESGVPCKELSKLIKAPELLGGRVKTLHPHVHAAILADRDDAAHMKELAKEGITPIDMVVVNFYPFAAKVVPGKTAMPAAIELIDIGGPTMVRAAAKNHKHVAIVTNVEQYKDISRELKELGDITPEMKMRLAAEAFRATQEFDSGVSAYFQHMLPKAETKAKTAAAPAEMLPDKLTLTLKRVEVLRYGENPHQKAARYSVTGLATVPFKVLQGKEMSYNNFLDTSSALGVVSAIYPKPVVACVVKHLNPCGIAVGDDPLQTFIKARESDAQSAFGGIVGLNCPVDAKLAEELRRTFLEIVVAPSFSDEARQVLASKLNLRLVQAQPAECRAIQASSPRLAANLFGVMLQEYDTLIEKWEDLQVVTDVAPAPALREDILLGMIFVRFLKSNSLCLVKDSVMVGAGVGQMSRVDAAKIALEKAAKRAVGAVLVSDGFFPYSDTIELASKAKVGCVVAPAGSKRDMEVVDAANKLKVPLVFAPNRHFWH